MQKQIIQHPEIKLVGLKVRTTNENEFTANAKIAPLIGRYFAENIADKIPNRKNPGITLVGYSNYESDEYGAYDYFFGEEVTSIDNLTGELSSLIIPAGKYLKITSDAGKMPDINIETWQTIWALTKNNELGAKRIYKTDFEMYDERASHPNQAVFDIYLGIE